MLGTTGVLYAVECREQRMSEFRQREAGVRHTESTVSTTALGNYFIGLIPGAWRFASVQ